MTDYYKTEKETLREAQEKARKYDILIERLKKDKELREEISVNDYTEV